MQYPSQPIPLICWWFNSNYVTNKTNKIIRNWAVKSNEKKLVLLPLWSWVCNVKVNMRIITGTRSSSAYMWGAVYREQRTPPRQACISVWRVCVWQQFLLKTQILIKIQIRLFCIDRQISLQFFRSDSFIPVYCQRDIAEIKVVLQNTYCIMMILSLWFLPGWLA